ncbi:MAG: SDR family oxidoreductase [Pseudomonadota bacterium]|nr:SDR family oxidoreductase [Pseudomonadota bacterium]
MSQAHVVLITGGSRGIGAAIARLAAAAGHAVVVNYARQADAAQRLCADIVATGGQALALQADVAQEAEVVHLFDETVRQLGRLDALVNNAGVVGPAARVDELSAERITRMFATNVLGSFLCAREAVRRMSTRHGGAGGAIVNITSRAADLGSPGEYVDYAASKAALETMTVGLAREVAREGIRVNAVSPGLINTGIHASGGQPDRVQRFADRIPMGRGGEPEEVARAVLWLLSDQASYVTGASLEVSGGR